MLGGRSIRIQAAQYSYFTDSKRSWPPIPTQHIYKSHTSPHRVPEKHILCVFSMTHSSSGWVLILSNFFWLKNMDRQLQNAVSDVFIRHLVSFLRLKVKYIWKSPKTSPNVHFLDTQLDFLPHIYLPRIRFPPSFFCVLGKFWQNLKTFSRGPRPRTPRIYFIMMYTIYQ